MSKIQLTIYDGTEDFTRAANKYWATDVNDKFVYRTGDIAAELGVSPQTLTALIRQNTIATATDKTCVSCGRLYPLTSRASFSDRKPSKAWQCSSCTATEKQRLAEASLKAKQLQRTKIAEFWEPSNRSARPVEEYSLMDAVSILSLIRGGAAEDYSYIRPVDFFDEPLTPSREFTVDILNYIFDRNLLTPHPGSSVDAFDFTNDGPTSFYLHKVHWVMPQQRNLRGITSTLESMITKEKLPPDWRDSVPRVWQDLVLQEGLELLKHYAAEHQLSLQVGEKTIDVLTSILKHYSVAQLQNFLWRAARDAAAYYMRGSVPRTRAANSIVTRLQGDYERALANNWEVKPYGRLFTLPQSLISKVFFNFVMKMPDSYRTSLLSDKLT